MKHAIKLACIIVELLAAVASAQSNWVQQWPKQLRATVKIDMVTDDGGKSQGTGVCVDPKGYVLTVEHVADGSRSFKVTIAGNTYPADLVYRDRSKQGDKSAVLKIRGPPPFPFVPMGKQTKKGDEVFSFGYPAGRFIAKFGKDQGGRQWYDNGGGDKQFLTHVNFTARPGHSGGPLFNARGRVVGVLTNTSAEPGVRYRNAGARVYGGGRARGSGWVKVTDLQNALSKAVGTKRKKTLYVFTADNCRACNKWYTRKTALGRDWAAQGGGDVVFVNLSQASSASIHQQYQTATGGKVKGTPHFWVEGTSRGAYETQILSGAAGVISVVGVIRWAVHSIARFLVGRAVDRMDSRRARPDDAPVPNVSAELPEDWSGVRIVVLAAEQDVGYVRGKARKTLIGIGRGRLERKILELTGGKAAVDLVAERIEPERYAAVLEAAGLATQAFDVLVLIPRTNKGLVKGLVVRKIEGIAVGKLKGVPIEPIFERVHAAHYAAIVAALHIEASEATSVPTGVVETITAAAREKIATAVFDRLKDRLPENVEAMVGKAVKQNTPAPAKSDEPSPWGNPLPWIWGFAGVWLIERVGKRLLRKP